MKLLKAWRASYSKWGMGSQGKLWNNLTLAIAFQGLLQFILPFVAKIEPICSELNVCGTVSKRWWPAHHKWVDLLPTSIQTPDNYKSSSFYYLSHIQYFNHCKYSSLH